ncbi:hypothetical protein PENFLA_c014G01620 [Penicillium flavigenum]|uniref:Uncharacterized protein n=1 Tax=Penicillium flavigenum TaxID=254877 RepID=A0A1V6T716_9EURO|nr:hypothetical protein PENFLA_c014G01620 [Penicillium flavigenum]
MLNGRGADGYKERSEDKAEDRNGLGDRYSHYQYTHGSLFFKGMYKRPHWLVAFGICDSLGLFKLVRRRAGVRVGVCNTGMNCKADPVYEPRKDANMQIVTGKQARGERKAIEEDGNRSAAAFTELQAERSGSAYSADQALMSARACV